jgi:transcriptional regulator GlxA family with amidase domain
MSTAATPLESSSSAAGVSMPHGFQPSAWDTAARRAVDFIVNRLDEPMSIQRLARASGLSTRTLHRVIRRHYGVSPMGLLRRARLARVRRELLAASPGTTVTTAALSCGFSHLGRFSQCYARQFGESPSDTLRRARAARAASAARHRPPAATPVTAAA